MIAIVEGEEERSIVTPNCRLKFRYLGDRWTHKIEVGALTNRRLFAEAMESNPEVDDFRNVCSPSFQDLHIQSNGKGIVALLVGQFGPRHFSVTFNVTFIVPRSGDRPSAGPPQCSTEIDVDMADRSRQPTDSLAATYIVRARHLSDPGDNCRINWLLASDVSAHLRLHKNDAPGSSLELTRAEGAISQIKLSRVLLPFQANGRLPFQWSVTTPCTSDVLPPS